MDSIYKKRLGSLFCVTKKWVGIAYYSEAEMDLMISYYGVPSDRLLNLTAAPIYRFEPAESISKGPIMSIGVAKRDYQTLIAALQDLPSHETEIYLSSRYGDIYKGGSLDKIPEWVRFEKMVSDEELVKRYMRARFIVLPLTDTTHFSAGVSVALEASAAGKAVIATKTQGMSSYVIEGVTGLLVPPYDSEAMQEAINKLWDNPNLAHQMGLAGREYVERKFNPVTVDQDLKQFLIDVYHESK